MPGRGTPNMKRYLVPMLLALIALACKPAANSSANAPATFTNDDQRTVYALGVMMSRNLAPFSLSDEEIDLFERGLRDGVAGRKPLVTVEEWGPRFRSSCRRARRRRRRRRRQRERASSRRRRRSRAR